MLIIVSINNALRNILCNKINKLDPLLYDTKSRMSFYHFKGHVSRFKPTVEYNLINESKYCTQTEISLVLILYYRYFHFLSVVSIIVRICEMKLIEAYD